MLSREDLLEYDVSYFDIYLKFLLIQLRTEVDVSELGASHEGEEAEPNDKLDLINKGLAAAKYCFLLKVKGQTYLISKVHIHGVVVYKDAKENRVILGCIPPSK